MKASKLLFFCFVITIAALLIVVKVTNTYRDKANIPPVQKSNPQQINLEGSVNVKVAPVPFLDNSDGKGWAFGITLDAHTGSLDEDLTKIATLQNDQGESVKPRTWDGSPPGGHHREGTLFFEPFSQSPKSVTLILRDVGGITERKFTWEAK